MKVLILFDSLGEIKTDIWLELFNKQLTEKRDRDIYGSNIL